jgi:hypothetical protein
VAAWSKAGVSGRSLAGIAGSNPAGFTEFCLLCCVFSCIGLGRADDSPRGVLWSVVCLSVIVKPRSKPRPTRGFYSIGAGGGCVVEMDNEERIREKNTCLLAHLKTCMCLFETI